MAVHNCYGNIHKISEFSQPAGNPGRNPRCDLRYMRPREVAALCNFARWSLGFMANDSLSERCRRKGGVISCSKPEFSALVNADWIAPFQCTMLFPPHATSLALRIGSPPVKNLGKPSQRKPPVLML